MSSGAGDSLGLANREVTQERDASVAKLKKILLVEDDDSLRITVADILRTEGYSVVVAGNGLEALQLLEAAGPEFGLIIVDLMMPVMDGRTFLKHERRRKFHHVHAIVYSATLRPAQTIEGAAACLSKPLCLDKFLHVVKAFYKD